MTAHAIRMIACLLIAVPFSTMADKQPSTPPFKSICTRNQTIGFNWNEGNWAQATFSRNKDFLLVEKVDCASDLLRRKFDGLDKCEQGVTVEKLFKESPAGSSDIHSGAGILNFDIMSYYLVRKLGESANPHRVESCFERFYGKLVHITCPESRIRFLPNGLFIELPSDSSVDVESTSNYKDSLAISVGKCSSLTN